MEELQKEEVTEDPSYWNSVFIAAVVFGIILSVGQLMEGYYAINTGSEGGWVSTVICLFGIFGGLAAVWHYAADKNILITLGKGALIGFLTGVGAQLVSYGIIEVWELMNPSYAEAYKEAQISVIEENPNIPEEWKQSSIDFIHDPSLAWSFIMITGGALMNGVLNMFTGMIGAKTFSSEG